MDMEGWRVGGLVDRGGGVFSPRSLNWLFVGLDWRGEEEIGVEVEEEEKGNRRR